MAKHVIHAHSSVSTNGVPKLPEIDRIEYGEIAINYAASAETISFKNTNNELVQVKTDEYYQVKFDDINQTIEDNELVTASALNDLNSKFDTIEIPDEVYIGSEIVGEPDIFIDTTENETIEIYTQEQVNDKLSAVTANANLYADSVSNNVLVGTESTSDKGNILVDTSEDANIEVYTKAQVDAIVASLEARIQALEN